MVVSGTVTDTALAVKRLYEQMPEPKYVISFGVCSNCGGPYWDSYSVTKGVDQISSRWTSTSPGARPAPKRCCRASSLQEKIARESLGERYSSSPRPSAAALQSDLVRPPAVGEDLMTVGQPPPSRSSSARRPRPRSRTRS